MVDSDRRVYVQHLTDEEVARIRQWTQTGRPPGGDTFLSKLETLPGRRLRPRTPRKGEKSSEAALS